MQFHRLKLTGFKSFVEPTELTIAPGLTGIVGPNGCGKSNLLEAIRWVMGESSAKSMRGGGMDDVIFAGTANRPPRDFAEVNLGASQEPGESLPSVELGPEGELEVTRRIERGAGSAYRVNGRDVRAKDVALIFADAATGAHSPALVSQGRIAAVIAAKPAERRAMLEEAAGISGLHVRRKDAEQKLRATEANLTRLADILTEMEGRAASLKRQAKAAERYVELSERIILAEGRTLFARHREAATMADEAARQAETADGAVRAAQEAQLGAAAITQQRITHLAQARTAAAAARDAASEARHRAERVAAERDALVRRLADVDAQIAQISADQAREGSLAQDAAAAIERLEAEEQAVGARIREANAARPEFTTRIAAAESAGRDADVALAQTLSRQASEQAEHRVADAALAAARQRIQRIDGERQRLDGAYATLPDPDPIEARRDAAQAARETALKEREAAEARITIAEGSRNTAGEAQASAQRAVATSKATLAAIESEATALRKATARTSTADRAVDHVRVAPGYERALAAALGDDLEAGFEAGAARWVGAAITALDPAPPKGCTSLAAHIEAPAALSRRLAQIMVAPQDEGQPLHVGQRLVTPDGRLRRWDGFIVEEGGAATAERLIRLNRLDAIGAELPTHEQAVATANATLATAETALRDALAEERAARQALSAAHEASRAADRTLGEVTTLIERGAEKRADLDRRAEEIARDLEAAQKELEQAQEARAALPDASGTADEVAALSRASEDAREALARLRAEQAMVDRAIATDKERQGAIRSEISGWRSRAGDAARRIADMTARAASLNRDLEENAGKPEELARSLALIAETAQEREDAFSAAEAAETSAARSLADAETMLAAANEALSSAREARAGAQARAEHAVQRRTEIGQLCGERFSCPPPVLPGKLGFESAEVGTPGAEQATLDKLTADRERLGPVNLVAARELAEIEETLSVSRAESEELTQAIHQLRGSIGNLNREGRQRLLAAFEAVNGHFQRLFTTLFEGGAAHLELVDSDDPLEAGLEIMAQPPGKRLTSLTLLSGGEQALTAVALIFGLFLTNPAPICVLDEVDAPLDDANIERFCDLLDRMVQDTRTRYLIVTHNAVTMSRMHRLFGVTMIERGISRLVSVDLQSAEALLAAE